MMMHQQLGNQENWTEDMGSENNNLSNQLKMNNNKMKVGAATSTNFMNSNYMNNQFKMSMLRSVQQNMPNMPNVSYY